MLELVGSTLDPAAKLDDGSAYGVYRRMIAAQGGDPDAELPRCGASSRGRRRARARAS
jgi:thymidine phosphorylase